MNQLKNEILALLEAGESAALATIINQAGSTPRTPGTCMVIRRDGSILGTIGGGGLEAEVIQAGRYALRDGTCSLRRFELTGAGVQDMDMICGGALDVLVEPLFADEQTVELLRTLCGLQTTGGEAFVLTLLQERGGVMSAKRVLATREPAQKDGFRFYPEHPPESALLLPLLRTAGSERRPTFFREHGLNVVIEPISDMNTVHLFGAGHVSKDVAAFAARVGFRVEVYDDRPEFANRIRYPHAEAVHVSENLDTALDSGRITDQSFVVIITRGHKHDMAILAQALRTSACYIGMIGSRRKRDAIYTALRQRGFSQAALDGVRCPIGLDIHAETPAEIALSIVGELVQVRAERSIQHSRPRTILGESD